MKELEPRYNHNEVEGKIYEIWEKSGFFNPDNLPSKKGKPYTIIMPPNNANGSLHLGHAVGLTLQDILIRYFRMKGRKTLWLPGADHAGFETQVVYDKKLDKEGRNRFSIPRTELWKEIWEFTQKNKELMYAQTKKLGASCDWSRETFTLDPKVVEIVYETFEKLYKDKLIYRDLKVVNWCPKHQTALSDLEVKYIEREDPLYFIKYGPLVVATVRPETKFGDTGLAVNPKDPRYKKYIGKEIEAIGILGPLKFRVIADEAVDPAFGTGVVKVTPAHDQTDFEMWQRHKDEIAGPKQIIDEFGKLTGEVGVFAGLKVAEARERVAEKMREIGILEKVEPNYKHQVATCYKCGNILEPLPKPQWFVKTKPLAVEAIKAVTSKKITIHPKHSEKIYLHWLRNIRDWNISRQIVWGIRIPAWYCLGCGKPKINLKTKAKWFFVRHGETEFNKEKRTMGKSPTPLNELGRQQIEGAAELLKNKEIGLIISSDLKRCEESALIISKKIGAEVIYDEGLREREFGVLEGMSYEDGYQKFGKDLVLSYEGRVPGGESYRDLENRVWKAFQNHKTKHGHKNVVIVTHGGPIRMLRKMIKNLNFDQAINIPAAKNAEIVEIEIGGKCENCKGDIYEQDPDVFDTWFSSGQWPFATLLKERGLKLSNDFKTFYPTQVMETGYDILFFWVARMVMLGLYRTKKIPFKDVYLHGLVRDKDKQKMSKSKGNVIDPLGVAEIYGTDAVRMALVVGSTPGTDIVISEDKIRGYRNFATKIWNASRFVLMNSPESPTDSNEKIAFTKGSGVSKTSSTKSFGEPRQSKNIIEVRKIKKEVAKHIEKFEFHLAAEKAYHYFWHTFADKIIEEAKPKLSGDNKEVALETYRMLETILQECLVMLHPFMPYVTEEIYRKINPDQILMIQSWDN